MLDLTLQAVFGIISRLFDINTTLFGGNLKLNRKDKNRKKFVRTGRGRKQDHGTRGNTNHNRRQRWFDFGYFDYDEIKRQELRRTLRRGGVIEEE